ncbi:hypothetical protein [Corynebacterium sp. ES2715-CONJ3]|uniref:hypothetical protein n=1 Tax=Corynebacterium sp. ES2715-CONJ3 TaxID=2974028 RepID=UPI002169B3DF|nr:hypothetical protein [Corynebacterium sp. ES2715-CONJ3]MCS4491549.1 hypothetical protein [Corynebacterium sp. ES2715-CONJ3]
MSKNNRVARAVNRAQKVQDRFAAIEAELLEVEREADRVLGEAVRLAVTNSRSKWADHIDLTVEEFYSMMVGDGVGSDESSDNATAVVGGSDGEEPPSCRRLARASTALMSPAKSVGARGSSGRSAPLASYP